jgi:hypothetical protein
VSHERPGVRHRAVVAPDGTFTLEGLSPGSRSLVVHDAQGRTIAERTVIVPEETEGQEVLLGLP